MSAGVTGDGGACCAASTAVPAPSRSTIPTRPRVMARISLLLANGRVKSAQVGQIAHEIVEIAIAQAIGPKGRHHRPRAVFDGLHLFFLVSLNPLARIHDLHREQVFVLL